MVLSRIKKRRIRRPPARAYRKPARRITLTELFDFIAMQYFSNIGSRIAGTFELERALKEAGLLIHHSLYAARVAAATFITLILSFYFSILIALSGIGLLFKVLIIILLLLSPLGVLGYMLSYPAIKRGQRKDGTETELPFFAAYLTTMVRSGVPISNVIERVARLKIFDAIRREALLISRNINLFGKDPLEAIEDVAISHPSFRFRDFMLGYTTTVKTGGDVAHYLEIRTQDIFQARLSEIKIIAERMSMFTEIYVTIAVIMTIVFYVFFTISSIFPAAGGFGGPAQLSLFSFVILPMLTLIMLYLIHAYQPKTPIKLVAPYRVLVLIGIPLMITLGPLTFMATGAGDALRGKINYDTIVAFSLSLSIALLSLSIPPAVSYWIFKRMHKGLAEATASFLRDLTEIRKTGLSPERSIIALADREYGPLSRIVAKVATALTIGLNIEQALRGALRGYKDWLLLANMRFLADSIELGGGSPETLDALARYAHNLTEIDKEMRKRLRTYIMMPYMGAILVAASSILVLGFTSETVATVGGGGGVASVSPEEMARVALLLSLGAILNSWFMGLVAGKIQDQTLAAGFIHSTILVLVTLVTIIVTLRNIGFLTS
ncbi:MAG: type II secretion system F family protein [Desulfurococcales archaeon]|nr:type II secretion system F family protein [Desulfurococcales archaeon]